MCLSILGFWSCFFFFAVYTSYKGRLLCLYSGTYHTNMNIAQNFDLSRFPVVTRLLELMLPFIYSEWSINAFIALCK
ncbi:hypothetical protein GGR55DRAFT_171245 [Xylaria sp. FL0064]|nr:hypothetical protein GGR55DRAFT_171245 [Xylaria sp. FL0064]